VAGTHAEEIVNPTSSCDGGPLEIRQKSILFETVDCQNYDMVDALPVHRARRWTKVGGVQGPAACQESSKAKSEAS
jgi:hypothetical protein